MTIQTRPLNWLVDTLASPGDQVTDPSPANPSSAAAANLAAAEPRDPRSYGRWHLTTGESIGLSVTIVSAAVTIAETKYTGPHWLIIVLMMVGILGAVVGRRVETRWIAGAGLLAGFGACLTATLLVPGGMAEIPVFSSAMILPRAITEQRRRLLATIAASIATGVVIAIISHSLVGLLAGLGIWGLADRAHEQTLLRASRDRALALLAELEASRQAQAEAAAAEERNRIAREMHDVLAHTLAGLSVQLQAVRAVAAKEGAPPSVTEPLDRAAELARSGVAEARSVVGTLRTPQPRGLDDLPALVEGYPGEARLNERGMPRRLGKDAGHALFRAIQETLTNTARYATGSPVTVTLDWTDPEWLTATTEDGGLPRDGIPSGITGNGSGIASMRERISAVGGTVEAGPRPVGGWEVHIRIPAS